MLYLIHDVCTHLFLQAPPHLADADNARSAGLQAVASRQQPKQLSLQSCWCDGSVGARCSLGGRSSSLFATCKRRAAPHAHTDS